MAPKTRLIWSKPGCQIALIFQPDDGVLRRKMRWPHVFTVFFHCLWV